MKILTPRVPPFKVTHGYCDTDKSATYDFLVFHSRLIMGLSRTVSELNGDFGRKIFPLRVGVPIGIL